jgi:diaminohydroxyphosphoribosylaminopyrimidine deaminase/5-amino-6-(5-phosphoribosylamino)uracil reductase
MPESAGASSPVGDDRARDAAYMRRALELAELGWGQTAPNPMVGAVVVAGDKTVGEGWHARYGEAHAEVMALRAAGARARGATVYVTLEPCAHFGKTPPCADALIAAGVARVVIAARDPSRIARGGAERLRAAGIRVDDGVERQAALELNAPFFNAHASDRPWVTLKLALAANGAVADPTGVHRWITGPAARAEVHRMRANSDAILVGIGTVLADDPELTVRDSTQPRVPPVRVVIDRQLRIPVRARLVRTARDVPTIVFPEPPLLDSARAESLRGSGVVVEGAIDLGAALRSLRSREVRSLFAEPGPRLAGALLRDALVDRLVIFRSTLVVGDDAPRAFQFAPPGFEASLASRQPIAERAVGPDSMTVYAFRDVPCSPD